MVVSAVSWNMACVWAFTPTQPSQANQTTQKLHNLAFVSSITTVAPVVVVVRTRGRATDFYANKIDVRARSPLRTREWRR